VIAMCAAALLRPLWMLANVGACEYSACERGIGDCGRVGDLPSSAAPCDPSIPSMRADPIGVSPMVACWVAPTTISCDPSTTPNSSDALPHAAGQLSLRPSQAGSLPGYVLGTATVFGTDPDCSCKPDMKVKLVVHSQFDGYPFNIAATRRRAGLEFQTAAGGRMKLRPVAAPTIWHGTARKSLARPTAHEYAPPARKPAPA